jgi:hypothetical protein
VTKRDLKRELKNLYDAPRTPVVVNVPTMRFLMVDGRGDPNTSKEYAEGVEALYTASYAAKFAVKKGPGDVDYGVMPLEGLWWTEDMSRFSVDDKAAWSWTIMIMQPDVANERILADAIKAAREKKDLPALSMIRVEEFAEGKAAQVLHVGPFTTEGPTIERLHAFVDAQGKRTGKHHEIYLSDIRRAAPAKWKTVIRQPFR